MKFKNMRNGCPWYVTDGKDENVNCMATNGPCEEDHCAMFHWICELVGKLYISIKADIKVD